MMKWVFAILISLSVVFGIGCGQMEEVSAAALSECGRAVELALTLTGSMCMWSGLMAVAQKSGLTEKIARLLSPLTCRIFRGISKTSETMQYITMNITANLLGLGNAATPLGIAAMQSLAKETDPNEKSTASDNMVLFVVLNTASIQLIPTTIAVLRLKYGASDPIDILPAVLLVSLLSLIVGITMAKLCNRAFPVRKRRRQQR